MTVSERMRIVVITGLSGAGRRSAAHTMEDLGWYVVDNVPATLLPALVRDLLGRQLSRLAVVLDVRSRSDLEDLPNVLRELAPIAEAPLIVYLEADDAVIVRRQESNRRPLPLQGDGTLLDGIQSERWMLSTLRAAADLVLDTSSLTVHQLQDRLRAAFLDDGDAAVKVTVMSFGFKYGLPLDADLVLDVRFLPNPHWVPELRPQTGASRAVGDFVVGQPLARRFLDGVRPVAKTLAEGYASEGKHLVELAVGCTGGKHRSVAMAIAIGRLLEEEGLAVTVIHRDMGRE
ncbi:MAG: RNase adapter RapZ [Propionibacteriaceae bacterium]|nr:RNase adapter RapZ [Propionibacteriaceae bacterium]